MVPHSLGFRLAYRPEALGFIRALLQFSKRAASETTKFSRGGIEIFGVIVRARFECCEPAAEAGELVR